jgi:PAS domain-containing protein
LLLVPPEEFLGKKFFDVLPLEAANAAAEEYRCFNWSAIFLELPLGKFWFELSIAPMEQSDDSITHFICLARDITVSKKDEALLMRKKRYRDF